MFLIYISLILCISNGSVYQCLNSADSTKGQCLKETIQCDTETDCTVQCSGKEACRDATIICPPDHICDVQCFTASHIDVTTNYLTCYNLTINASLSTRLIFTANFGDTGESLPNPRTFEDGTIYCPHNGRNGINPNIKPCQINCDGDSLMRRPKIYAVEGTNDLDIQSTHYNHPFCFRKGSVYCKQDFSGFCWMQNEFPFDCQDILHKDDDFTCQEYLITTDAPTPYNGPPTTPTAPTTQSLQPTQSPTGADELIAKNPDDGLTTTQLILAILLPLLAVACVCMGFGIWAIKKNSDSKGQHQTIENKDNDSDIDNNEAFENNDGTGEALPAYKQVGPNNTENYSSDDDSKSDSQSGNQTSSNNYNNSNNDDEQVIDMGQPNVNNDGDTGIYNKDNNNNNNNVKKHKVSDDAYSDEEY